MWTRVEKLGPVLLVASLYPTCFWALPQYRAHSHHQVSK